MRYLLDTSAIIAHHRQEAGWHDVQLLFENGEDELFMASVSLAELGRRLREFGATEVECHAVLSAYQLLFAEVVSVDAAVARAAFTLGCQTSERLPLADALIAAAAQAKDAVLVHRDDHMRRIPAQLLRQHDLARAGAE